MLKVKIKKLNPNAVIPKYSREGDAGLDLTSISRAGNIGDYAVFYTGLAIEIPKGYVGLIFPRSSISDKNQMLTNHVGVIDSNYRGEITFRFKKLYENSNQQEYYPGERVGQLLIIPYPEIEFEEVTELSETERGSNGFGSSGS